MLSRRPIRLTGKWKGYIVIIFILAFFLIADSGPLAENTRPRVLRSRAYRLQIALNRDIKHQLESLGIGTKIDLLPQNAMIVTAADVEDLIAASSLINLIDSKQTYVVKVLADYSESDTLPTMQQIADSIGISGIGSFAEPPAVKEPDRIIVDVRDSKIIAVVPTELLDRVAAAVSELMAASKADKSKLAEDAEQTQAVADETGEAGVQPQVPQVADVKPEATIGDVIDELLVTDYPAKETLEVTAEAAGAETPKVADVKPETTAANVSGGGPPAEDLVETTAERAPTVADKPESHDFFQAEMFESLAEAEINAKTVLGEIAQAERKANEALARAMKAEELAREKERLAAEAARLAAEADAKAPATAPAKQAAPAGKVEGQDFFQAEIFRSLAEAESKAKAALEEIAEAERSANEALARAIKAEELARDKERLAAEAARLAAEAAAKVPATEPVKQAAPATAPAKQAAPAGKVEGQDFFQAEIFRSLAEAESKAKAALEEIAEAERSANEALARAIKAEELAREKQRLAAEAVRRATEAERKAAEAQEAVLPDQPVKKKMPTQPDAGAQKPETQPKTEVTSKMQPKAAAKTEDKTQSAVAPKAKAQAPPKTEAASKTEPKAVAKTEDKTQPAVAPKAKAQVPPKTEAASKTEPKAVAKTEDKTQPAVDPNASTEMKSTVRPPAADDNMLEMLKKLAAKEAAIAEDKPETAVAEERIPPIPLVPPVPKTTTGTTTPVPPVPKRTTPRIPPGTGGTDKIATETPSKIESTMPDPEEEIFVILPEKVQISSLIELVGKQLKINYMYDTKLVTGEVFLKIHDGRIKVKDMYALLESVLKFKGFAMTRRRNGNLVTIMAIKDINKLDPEIRTDSDDTQLGQVVVSTIFKLEHISTATAQAMLKNMNLGLSYNPIEETKTLIVTGYAYRMARMEEVLKMIDVPGKERIFRSRKLEYLLPSELAEKVVSLAQELGTISITVSAKPVTPARPATPARPTGRTPRAPVRPPARVTTPKPKTPVDTGVYLDTDDRTNRVLMIGLEDDLVTVDMLIDSLDVAKYGLMSVKEYAMEYVEATEILNTLGELGVISSMPRSSMMSRLPTTVRAPTTRTPTTRTPTTRMPTSYGAARPVPGEPQISVRLATNSLLVNATPEQHAEIEMMIRFVDVEQKDIRTVQEYEIQYVEITEVVETLAELGIVEQRASAAPSRRADGYTSSRTPAGARIPTSTRATTTTGAAAPAVATTTFETTTGAEITSEQPQIAVLESTNSLLVYATPKQHDTIALIVAHVDRELTDPSTPYVVYTLENQDPEELVATLNEIVQATIKEAPRSSTSKIQTKAPATAGIPPKREKNEIQIVADLKSYSLIVYADKKNQQWISALIEELDAYRPQVLLDVTLVEITKNDKFTYNLDLIGKLPNLIPGQDLVAAGTALGGLIVSPQPGVTVQEFRSNKGTGRAFYSDSHIQAILEAVEEKSYGRILARPKLLVNDNEVGTIKSEETEYVPRTKSSIVPTTSDTSQTVTDVQFDPYTAGIELTIEPHISKGDELRLKIKLNRIDFSTLPAQTVTVGDDTFTAPKDTFATDLDTTVTVPNGYTIILGGLENITQSKGGNKVPILGDLPLIGGLFRSVDNTDDQNRLYVFVKAYILRPGEELTKDSDLGRVSRTNRESFEELERKFQEYENWPGAKPDPMDPMHILEEDADFEGDESIQELKNRLHKDEKVSVEAKLGDAY